MMRAARLLLLLTAAWLTGCDLLGIEPASAVAARREADGKAVGGACRHAGRAIEDCYELNPRADRAAVFAGWREFNDYMTENKIEVVKPEGTEGTEMAASGDEEETPAPPKKAAKSGKSRGG